MVAFVAFKPVIKISIKKESKHDNVKHICCWRASSKHGLEIQLREERGSLLPYWERQRGCICNVRFCNVYCEKTLVSPWHCNLSSSIFNQVPKAKQCAWGKEKMNSSAINQSFFLELHLHAETDIGSAKAGHPTVLSSFQRGWSISFLCLPCARPHRSFGL